VRGRSPWGIPVPPRGVEGDLPDDLDDLKWLGIFALVVIMLAVILGSSTPRSPCPPPPLERRARETSARSSTTERGAPPRRNLLEGWRSPPHPAARFARGRRPELLRGRARPKKVIAP
jgi:hypothetical protein